MIAWWVPEVPRSNRSADAVSSSVMADLVISIPDELAQALVAMADRFLQDHDESPRPATGPAFLSVSEAAKMLGSSREIVDDLIHAGKIAAINLNDGLDKRALWRVPMTAIQAALDKAESNLRD